MNPNFIPYLCGVLAVVAIYILSFAITKSWSPIALALGHNKELSTSLLQNLIFTTLIVFSYVTVAVIRFIESWPNASMPVLPSIPVNLFVLMGFSLSTAIGSKAIALSYLRKGQLPAEDDSTLTRNRLGEQDLTKVQMIIWTCVAAGIYLLTLTNYIGCITGKEINKEIVCPQTALPDIDPTLLILMGVSQGGYLAGKVFSRTTGEPIIEDVLPAKAKKGEQVTILGMEFGEPGEGNTIILEDSSGKKLGIDQIDEWTDNRIKFMIPDLEKGEYRLAVRSKGLTGKSSAFDIAE
jgi:hypothetical protein